MSSIEELMRYAKDSKCACSVCHNLRQMLMAKMYTNLEEMKQKIKDMEDAKEDSDTIDANT